MQLSLVSALAPTGKADAATDEPAQGFEALLAALLPTPEADAGLPTPLLPVAEAAAEGGMTAPDALQALLASLPPSHLLAMPAAAAGPEIPEAGTEGSPSLAAIGNDAAPAAPKGSTPALPVHGAEPAAARTGKEPTPANSHHASFADAIASHAQDRPPLADRLPPALPLADGSPGRRTGHDGPLVETPAIFAADHRASLAATELPARQTVLPVAPALSSPAWSNAFSEQVVWAARAGLQSASLTLNPPELGPVRIELQLGETQASASFSSAQPEVRKAIEDALPALKTLFAEAGLNLAQADIGGGHAQSQPGRDGRPANRRGADAATQQAAVAASGLAATTLSRGLLDTFA